ncbi:MAG: CTP synthetase, partial [Lentisphaerae bacterium]
PFLGICLGMQCSVIEFARHCCHLTDATSSEFDPDSDCAVIDLMPDQSGIEDKGGTMRLGQYPCVLSEGSHAAKAYGTLKIQERHRHRYEVNNAFREQLEAHGMRFSGLSPDGRLVEIVEIENHPWFVACQFHPEFKSKPLDPHPLFSAFIGAAMQYRDEHY